MLSPKVAPPPGELRRLGAADRAAVEALDEDIQWISGALDGPRALAEMNTAFGGFGSGRLASVAVPFYVGERLLEPGLLGGGDRRHPIPRSIAVRVDNTEQHREPAARIETRLSPDARRDALHGL